VRKRSVETRDELTAQEEQNALLDRGGLSIPEIGARLFLSPRTIEWHLRNVFTKLGIGSRRELRRALPASESQAVPAYAGLAKASAGSCSHALGLPGHRPGTPTGARGR